jgi:hypothetical protein
MAGIGTGDFHLLVIFPVVAIFFNSGQLRRNDNIYLLVIFPIVAMIVIW